VIYFGTKNAINIDMRKLYNISINPARCLVIIFSLFFIAGTAWADISVISPSSRTEVKSNSDYADEVLHDRWDMNERTDLGWRIFNTVELPHSNLTNISFQNGIFSADSVYTGGTGDPNYSDANIFILDSAYPGSAMLGKVGSNYPVNANKYTILAIRMYLEPGSGGPFGQLTWSTNTMYGGSTTGGSFFVYDNWVIYMIDIPALGIAAGNDPWAGLIDSLRLDPLVAKDKTIKIDWIRLVEDDSGGERTISWNGASGNVDIYLDNNTNSGDGNLGILARNVSGSSYTFPAGALGPGDYYVAIAPTGTTSYDYSSGYYHINDAPIINLTKPSAEGSDTDYISVELSDPWDMSNSADVEERFNVQNDQFTSINYEDKAGNNYYSQAVYYGESTHVSPPAWGDPMVYFQHFLLRGATHTIDSSRYHNLTFKMGIAGAHSTADGSIARVVWKLKGESGENVSEDLIIRHLPNRWIMNKIVCDLNGLPLEAGGGSPSHSGWTGEIDSFRIDPHEFRSPRGFFFDEVRITADWKATTSFSLEWLLSDSDNTPSVSLYYDNNNSGFDGTPIVSGLSSSPGLDAYSWNTSSVPEGKYWIYAVVDDGSNQNRVYSSGPVFVDHALVPEISLSKETVRFGYEVGGPDTSDEKVYITNSGQGSLNWEAVTNKSWITVQPGSGIGEGSIDIGVNPNGLSSGSYSGMVIVSDDRAQNSPKYINVYLEVYGSGAESGPFGFFDTPANGVTVSGEIPVTGWALDDIEVAKIEIRRNSIQSDPPHVIGPDGLVYVGNAIFVKGFRPDIKNAFPNYPKNDRAGWGYMMLPWLLPEVR